MSHCVVAGPIEWCVIEDHSHILHWFSGKHRVLISWVIIIALTTFTMYNYNATSLLASTCISISLQLCLLGSCTKDHYSKAKPLLSKTSIYMHCIIHEEGLGLTLDHALLNGSPWRIYSSVSVWIIEKLCSVHIHAYNATLYYADIRWSIISSLLPHGHIPVYQGHH